MSVSIPMNDISPCAAATEKIVEGLNPHCPTGLFGP